MHIGVLSYDYEPPIGGLGVVAKMYATSLQDASSEVGVTVFSASPAGSSYLPALASSRWKKAGGCPLFSLVLNFVLPQLIAKHAVDVLHLHAGSGGVFLLYKPACPLVVTAHHTYAQESSLLFRSQPHKRFWKYILSFLERRTYNVADVITCVSADTAQALERDYGIQRSKLVVIENPVDDIFFSSNEAEATKEDATLVYVGRIEERKGVHTLLQAFSTVASEFPALRLVLVGTNLIGSKLSSLLTSLGIADRVTCTGWLSQEKRIEFMRSATAIIVPSLLEGFGLVAAEAMALGTPVIASSSEGLRSLIVHGKTGLLFEVLSSADLANRIRFTLSNSGSIRSMAQAAAVDARERFTGKNQVQKLQKILLSELQK